MSLFAKQANVNPKPRESSPREDFSLLQHKTSVTNEKITKSPSKKKAKRKEISILKREYAKSPLEEAKIIENNHAEDCSVLMRGSPEHKCKVIKTEKISPKNLCKQSPSRENSPHLCCCYIVHNNDKHLNKSPSPERTHFKIISRKLESDIPKSANSEIESEDSSIDDQSLDHENPPSPNKQPCCNQQQQQQQTLSSIECRNPRKANKVFGAGTIIFSREKQIVTRRKPCCEEILSERYSTDEGMNRKSNTIKSRIQKILHLNDKTKNKKTNHKELSGTTSSGLTELETQREGNQPQVSSSLTATTSDGISTYESKLKASPEKTLRQTNESAAANQRISTKVQQQPIQTQTFPNGKKRSLFFQENEKIPKQSEWNKQQSGNKKMTAKSFIVCKESKAKTAKVDLVGSDLVKGLLGRKYPPQELLIVPRTMTVNRPPEQATSNNEKLTGKKQQIQENDKSPQSGGTSSELLLTGGNIAISPQQQSPPEMKRKSQEEFKRIPLSKPSLSTSKIVRRIADRPKQTPEITTKETTQKRQTSKRVVDTVDNNCDSVIWRNDLKGQTEVDSQRKFEHIMKSSQSLQKTSPNALKDLNIVVDKSEKRLSEVSRMKIKNQLPCVQNEREDHFKEDEEKFKPIPTTDASLSSWGKVIKKESQIHEINESPTNKISSSKLQGVLKQQINESKFKKVDSSMNSHANLHGRLQHDASTATTTKQQSLNSAKLSFVLPSKSKEDALDSAPTADKTVEVVENKASLRMTSTRPKQNRADDNRNHHLPTSIRTATEFASPVESTSTAPANHYYSRTNVIRAETDDTFSGLKSTESGSKNSKTSHTERQRYLRALEKLVDVISLSAKSRTDDKTKELLRNAFTKKQARDIATEGRGGLARQTEEHQRSPHDSAMTSPSGFQKLVLKESVPAGQQREVTREENLQQEPLPEGPMRANDTAERAPEKSGRRIDGSRRIRANKYSPVGARKGEELRLRTPRTSYPLNPNHKDASTPTHLREYLTGSVNGPLHDLIDPFRRMSRTSFSTFPHDRHSVASARGGGFTSKCVMVCEKGHPATTEYIQVTPAEMETFRKGRRPPLPLEQIPERTYRSSEMVNDRGSTSASVRSMRMLHKQGASIHPYNDAECPAGHPSSMRKSTRDVSRSSIRRRRRRKNNRIRMIPSQDQTLQANPREGHYSQRGLQSWISRSRQRHNRSRLSHRMEHPISVATEATTMGTPTSMQLSDRTMFSSTGESEQDSEHVSYQDDDFPSESGRRSTTGETMRSTEENDAGLDMDDARRHLLFKFLSKSMYCHVIHEKDSRIGILQSCAIELDDRTAIIIIPAPLDTPRWDHLWNRTLPTIDNRNVVITMSTNSANEFCDLFSFRPMAVPIHYVVLPPKLAVNAPRTKGIRISSFKSKYLQNWTEWDFASLGFQRSTLLQFFARNMDTFLALRGSSVVGHCFVERLVDFCEEASIVRELVAENDEIALKLLKHARKNKKLRGNKDKGMGLPLLCWRSSQVVHQLTCLLRKGMPYRLLYNHREPFTRPQTLWAFGYF